MNRNRRLTVLLLATLALLMLAGCSVLDPLLHPDHEVTGNPDERDTRFVEGSAYHGKDPETRVEPVTDENGEPVTDENGEIVTAVVPVGTETATGEAETQDPYRDLTEQERSDLLMLRCMRRVFDEGGGVLADQADPDMKSLFQLALKVSHERERLKQFVRLQKAADGTYFAAVTPEHDALPLAVDYFTDRFADQRWLIYDRRRDCGYYYDGHTARCVTLEDDRGMIADKLADEWLAEDERQFQLLWKNYFRALAIPQRINERQQRRMMPRRYWKHLTEME